VQRDSLVASNSDLVQWFTDLCAVVHLLLETSASFEPFPDPARLIFNVSLTNLGLRTGEREFMIRQITITAMVATSLSPVTIATPVLAQSSGSPAPICQTYNSNGRYGFAWTYASHNNVDLASTFSTIDSISGTVVLQTSVINPPITVPILNPAPAGLWAAGGYAWQSIHTTATGATGPMLMDIRFGPSKGIYPGQTNVPTGIQPLYVVGRTGITDTKSFSLTICGQPKSTQTCTILTVSQAPGVAGRFAPSAMIPASFPATAKIVSLKSTNMTVAANGSTPAETQAIITPTGPNQPKTANYPVAMNNRHLRFFMTPSTHATDYPVDTWRGQAGQPRYLTIGATVKPGWFVSPVNSWVGPVGAADTPAHGIASGQVELCVQ
jgi:hypothetical protein